MLLDMEAYAPFFAVYWPYLASLVLGLVIMEVLRSFPRQIKPNYTTEVDPYQAQADELTRDPLGFNITGRSTSPYVSYPYFDELALTEKEMKARARDFYVFMNKRRTVRNISSDPVPLEIIEDIVRVAGTSPSGAHSEPWTYVVVSSQDLKEKIRSVVEQEEHINYSRRMGEKFKKDLEVLHTTWSKPYLSTAPYIILVFKRLYGLTPEGEKKAYYYNEQSACISSGFLVAAIHNAGLVTVTTTPMNAGPKLRELLERPVTEKLLFVLPVGYPAKNAKIPDLKRKSLNEFMILK